MRAGSALARGSGRPGASAAIRRAAAGPLVLSLAMLAASCAVAPAPRGPATPPSGPGTPVGTTASGGRITSTAPAPPAVVDSGPSREAEAVLATIPEPLPPEERVPPPDSSMTRRAPEMPEDTPGTSPADTTGFPIPSPTEPLGDRPGGGRRTEIPDSLLIPSNPPRSAPGAPAARGDTCWRIQVRAPSDRPTAETFRQAAESQLLLPMVIEAEKGLYKVRTRDCLASGAVADSLRRRAVSAGFPGAFRFAGKRP